MKDAGRAPMKEFKQAAAVAKLYATESAVTATRIATQVFGGYGFMEEYPVARFYRDAKVLEIGEGTSEVQRMLIARGSACRSSERGRPPRLVRVGHRMQRLLAEATKFLTVGGVATLVALRALQRRWCTATSADPARCTTEPLLAFVLANTVGHGGQLPRQPVLGVPAPGDGRGRRRAARPSWSSTWPRC